MFSRKFPESCLKRHGGCLVVFSLPWKERMILPYPPRKTNMLPVFVRIGPNPVWLYRGQNQGPWLRGDFGISSLKGGSKGWDWLSPPGSTRGQL